MDVSRTVYRKNGNKWETTYTETEPAAVYKSLADDLIQKKVYKVAYIKSIICENNFDGTRRIDVYYIDGIKARYIVKR